MIGSASARRPAEKVEKGRGCPVPPRQEGARGREPARGRRPFACRSARPRRGGPSPRTRCRVCAAGWRGRGARLQGPARGRRPRAGAVARPRRRRRLPYRYSPRTVRIAPTPSNPAPNRSAALTAPRACENSLPIAGRCTLSQVGGGSAASTSATAVVAQRPLAASSSPSRVTAWTSRCTVRLSGSTRSSEKRPSASTAPSRSNGSRSPSGSASGLAPSRSRGMASGPRNARSCMSSPPPGSPGRLVERRLPGLGHRQRVACIRRPPRQHLEPGRGELLPVAGDAYLARPHEGPCLRQGQGQAAELLGPSAAAARSAASAAPSPSSSATARARATRRARAPRPCPPTPANAR